MDYIPINWAIIRNPLNWAKVLLMAVTAMIAFQLVMTEVHNPNSEDMS